LKIRTWWSLLETLICGESVEGASLARKGVAGKDMGQIPASENKVSLLHSSYLDFVPLEAEA
jgi:hypothetical protein